MMEAMCSSETSIHFQQNTQPFVTQVSALDVKLISMVATEMFRKIHPVNKVYLIYATSRVQMLFVVF
jgi:hypothetical protein